MSAVPETPRRGFVHGGRRPGGGPGRTGANKHMMTSIGNGFVGKQKKSKSYGREKKTGEKETSMIDFFLRQHFDFISGNCFFDDLICAIYYTIYLYTYYLYIFILYYIYLYYILIYYPIVKYYRTYYRTNTAHLNTQCRFLIHVLLKGWVSTQAKLKNTDWEFITEGEKHLF